MFFQTVIVSPILFRFTDIEPHQLSSDPSVHAKSDISGLLADLKTWLLSELVVLTAIPPSRPEKHQRVARARALHGCARAPMDLKQCRQGAGRELLKAIPLVFGPKYLQLKGIRQSPAGAAFSVTALVQGCQAECFDSMVRVLAPLMAFEPLQ